MMRGLVVEKFNGENFLSFADRFESLMILENALYENMLNGAESKDEEIDDDDFTNDESISLSKRLKHILLLHCEKMIDPVLQQHTTSTQAVQPTIQNDIYGTLGFYYGSHLRVVYTGKPVGSLGTRNL